MLKHFGILVLLFSAVSCATPAAPAPVSANPARTAPNIAPSSNAASAACAFANAAPKNEFRSDDPAKLTASVKPKLVEFFAYW
ncbi:MAG: hypothetical protein HY070_08380 [Chloroflexi bacterium]|nr:hypothetical protein [Chloroflexota bacterium]